MQLNMNLKKETKSLKNKMNT